MVDKEPFKPYTPFIKKIPKPLFYTFSISLKVSISITPSSFSVKIKNSFVRIFKLVDFFNTFICKNYDWLKFLA